MTAATAFLRRSEPRRAKTGELGDDSAPLDGPEAGGDGGVRLLQLPAPGECSRNCGSFRPRPEKSEAPGDGEAPGDDGGPAEYGTGCLSGQLSSDTATVSNRSDGMRICCNESVYSSARPIKATSGSP